MGNRHFLQITLFYSKRVPYLDRCSLCPELFLKCKRKWNCQKFPFHSCFIWRKIHRILQLLLVCLHEIEELTRSGLNRQYTCTLIFRVYSIKQRAFFETSDFNFGFGFQPSKIKRAHRKRLAPDQTRSCLCLKYFG